MSFKKIRNSKERGRQRRKRFIRKRISGTSQIPRLSVFRSLKHIYVQAVDDVRGVIVATSSDLDKGIRDGLGDKKKKERAREVGKAIAAKLLENKIQKVVFDRNGFIYHGRIKEVADGAREGGLEF